jgi:hypothetical protein
LLVCLPKPSRHVDQITLFRQKLLDAAHRRDIDVVVVWRLDRWGRSMADLVNEPRWPYVALD